jgi:hypothetical protein
VELVLVFCRPLFVSYPNSVVAGNLALCQEELKDRDHTLAIVIAAVLGVFMAIALVIYLYRSRQRSGYQALS